MPRLTIEQLVQRATGGEKFNRHKLFRPSLTYYLLKDPFWLWCGYHAPKAEAIDERVEAETGFDLDRIGKIGAHPATGWRSLNRRNGRVHSNEKNSLLGWTTLRSAWRTRI
jgi:hypothetical protein